jgi:hypothetical protein
MIYNDPADSPYGETCTQSIVGIDQSQYIVPPAAFVQNPSAPNDVELSSATEWRLIEELRTYAQPPANAADPTRAGLTTLVDAAIAYARGDAAKANAIADLSVTGRFAYEAMGGALAENHLTSMQDVTDWVDQQVTNQQLGFGYEEILEASTSVAWRAQQVAWALRGSPAHRQHLRPNLGWLAVSGEDDRPHRPCNIPSLPCPQYDLSVSATADVGGIVTGGSTEITVATRFAIAQGFWPPTYPDPGGPTAEDPLLPIEAAPSFEPCDVIFLYIHGDDSRAEEAADIIPALLRAAIEREMSAAVLVLDIPPFGYSRTLYRESLLGEMTFDHSVLPYPEWPTTYPALDFIENYIVAFVNTLDRIAPCKDKIVPIGGSLGGNMALRLGRPREDAPWVKKVCGWSPASVWRSYANASGVDPITQDIDADAMSTASARMETAEETDPSTPAGQTQRHLYFNQVYDTPIFSLGITVIPAQPYLWYRDDWKPCQGNYILADRLAQRELYGALIRRWHWRMGYEQLIYSHLDTDPATGQPRYAANSIPMLLLAGGKDNWPGTNIWDRTQDIVKHMTATPGSGLFVNDTGHSIHNERPRHLAEAICDFIPRAWGPSFGNISADPKWIGDFTGSGKAEVLFYSPGDQNWWHGTFTGGNLGWTLAGNTKGFGNTQSDPTWIGNFTGSGKSQLLFYSPGDQNWWLGTFTGGSLGWTLAGNTKGFGNTRSDPTWIGNFTGSGKAEVLFYSPGDQNWWHGSFAGANLGWTLAGNTKGFGNTRSDPTWIGNFTGSGKSEVLFYSPGDQNWWLGTFAGSSLGWTLAGNTKGFGNTQSDPAWIGNFTGNGKSQLLFYSPGDQNWWLGTFAGDSLGWTLAVTT